jgi:large conductance mechanosensitive channel
MENHYIETRPLLSRHTNNTIWKCRNWIKAIGNDFKAFVNKGSVASLAVGIVIGESFSAVVNSFVGDIITPILGLFLSTKLTEVFLVIRKGSHYPYKTRDEARKDGAVTWNYGNFIQLVTNFLIVSICLFVIIRMMESMHRRNIESNTMKTCRHCFSVVDGRATKCAHCTAELEPMEIEI